MFKFKKDKNRKMRIVYDYLMKEYFSVIRANEGVNIPYFLRHKEERYEYQAKCIIARAIKLGKFNELYKRAIAA